MFETVEGPPADQMFGSCHQSFWSNPAAVQRADFHRRRRWKSDISPREGSSPLQLEAVVQASRRFLGGGN